jgi:uncharacterized protein (DUF433 family)
MVAIVGDDEIRSGDPRIEGTRITVLDIKRRVIDGDEDPFAVATDYELDASAVFAALSYYYEHADEMRELENEHSQRVQEIRRESAHLRPETDEVAEQ